MKKLIVLILSWNFFNMNKFLVILLFVSTQSFARNFYIASSGNDANTGTTTNSPFKTIARAVEKAVAGDSILFKRGDIFYGTIRVKDNWIHIGSYGTGSKPVITGLTSISSWTNLGGGLYRALLSTYPSNQLSLVLFRNKIQAIGRYPKAGLGDASYFTIDTLGANSNVPGAPRDFRSKRIGMIPNFIGGELVQRSEQWVFDRSKVIGQTSSKISYSPEVSPDHPSVNYPSKKGHGFFFQNHLNCLSQLGDWYYDNSAKSITMYFGKVSPRSYTVQVATLDNGFLNSQHKNITVDNLCFKGYNGNAIQLDIAQGIKMKNDSIIDCGQNGIDVSRSNNRLNNNHNSITDCVIKNCLNNGLNLVQSTNWLIDNNHIENIGKIQGMGLSGDGQYVGVFKMGDNSVFEYNEVDSIGYNAVWYTGNNIMIRKNHIHDFCMRKSDGGGIYSYGNTGNGIYIENNIVHDGKGDLFGMGIDLTNPYIGQIHGIYNDGNVNGVNETYNTVFNNSSSGFWFGSNTNITASNNTAYNNTVAQMNGNESQGAYVNVNIKNNILFCRDSGQLIHQFLIVASDLRRLHLDSNIYARPIWQPSGIKDDRGYSRHPNSWASFHDGGIIETGQGNHFYSLDGWQTFSGLDLHSKRFTGSFNRLSDINFQYNATKYPRAIELYQKYYDVKGNHYTPGKLIIPPFSSIILIKESMRF